MEEIIHEIEYDGKSYTIQEPTLEMWANLMTQKDFDTDFELAMRLISMATGLNEEELREASAGSVYGAADGLIEYYSTQDKTYHESFEFNGKKYKFVNLSQLSFGEFVDIDDLTSKPEVERLKNLHKLMALLYREVDEKGNYLNYDLSRIDKTAEEFKKLPVKYFNGALFFFYVIELTLLGNIRFSIRQKEWWKLMMFRAGIKIKTLLDGIVSYITWPVRISSIYLKSLKSTILNVSIFSHIKQTWKQQDKMK